MKDTNKSLLWGTLIGTIAGSITALLFAPKSGAELRSDIAENAKLVSEKGQDFAEKVSGQSSKIASKVKQSTEGIIQEIRTNFKDNSECGIAKVSSISVNTQDAPTARETEEDKIEA
ncbi:YtxH domain-containing protein [Neobacillus mesonae]|nr:YtxH domain-containing protein [Neobacillus mesonae]